MIQKYRIVEDGVGSMLAPDGRQTASLYRAERKIGGFYGLLLDLIFVGTFNRWEVLLSGQRFDVCFVHITGLMHDKPGVDPRSGMRWLRMFNF